jgi:hypothetical protein
MPGGIAGAVDLRSAGKSAKNVEKSLEKKMKKGVDSQDGIC